MHREPAAIAAAIAAVLNIVVLLVFGQELTLEQESAIVGAVTVVAGLYIRSQVSPAP